MPQVTNEEVKGGKKKGQKAAEQTGTMKPLPTSAGQPKDPAKEKELSDLAKAQNDAKAAELAKKKAEIEEKRAKLKALQEELKKEKDAEAAIKKAEKEAKDAEKNKAKRAREEAEAKIKEADEAVAQAQKDLEATEEWKFLVAAKEARAAIGPLPKVRKPREGGVTRAPRESKRGELTGAEYRTMRALADHGRPMTRKELATVTGQEKGWSKLLGTKDGGGSGLCDRELVAIVLMDDNAKAMSYKLTPLGEKALDAAEKAAKEAPPAEETAPDSEE